MAYIHGYGTVDRSRAEAAERRLSRIEANMGINPLALFPRKRIQSINADWILRYSGSAYAPREGDGTRTSRINIETALVPGDSVAYLADYRPPAGPRSLPRICVLADDLDDDDAVYANRLELLGWISAVRGVSVTDVLLDLESYASPLERLAGAAE